MPKAPPRLSKAQSRKAWDNKTQAKRITGRALQRERRALFDDQPLCKECTKEGRVTAATIRDHITPLAFGGTDTRANTQPLCKAHHDAKTKAESAQGARQARADRGG